MYTPTHPRTRVRTRARAHTHIIINTHTHTHTQVDCAPKHARILNDIKVQSGLVMAGAAAVGDERWASLCTASLDLAAVSQALIQVCCRECCSVMHLLLLVLQCETCWDLLCKAFLLSLSLSFSLCSLVRSSALSFARARAHSLSIPLSLSLSLSRSL